TRIRESHAPAPTRDTCEPSFRAAIRATRRVRQVSRVGAGAWLSRMRVGPAGAIELPCRTGAEQEQRGTRQQATVIVRHLGLVEYEPTWRAMQRFTEERTQETPDEIWFLEHPPVFTLGMNATREH